MCVCSYGWRKLLGKEKSQVILVEVLIAEHLVNRSMMFARRSLIFGILLTGCSYFRIVHEKQT